MACFQTGLAGTSGEGDPVTRSLRLASGASTGDSSSHLDRNSIGTPTDGTKWTFSAWVKRSELDNSDSIFAGGTNSSNFSILRFRNNLGQEDQLFYDDKSDGSARSWRWSPMLRDPSAFFNLMLVYDASQSAQADKMRLYINGVLAPSATTSGSSSITHTMSVSKSGMNQIIGNNSVNDAKANLLIADVYFLDGVAKTVTGGVTDFTELNGYGGLKPKEYTGTDFGNNGFHIDAQPAHDAELLVSSIDRNDGDTLFADAAKGHVLTASGNTHHDNTVGNPFGSGTAMYFDGNGDTIVAAASSDFAFGTGDFTVEGWWYFESIPSSTDAMLVDFRPTNSTTTTSFAFSTDTTNGVKVYSGGNYVLGGSLSTNTWHHIALVRDSGTLYAYIDGTATGTTASFSSNLTANSTPRLGTTADGGLSAAFTGYIFDVRITKGTARYTSNFTAPSAPLELNPVYIGGDQSGNKNHFAPTNLNSTDIREDNPFKNHATWNPLIKRSSTSNIFTYSEGNTVATYTGGVAHTSTTIASTGVHYAEFAFSGGTSSISGAGVVRARWNGGSADSYTTNYGGCYYGSSGNVNSPSGSTSVSAVGSDRLGIAFDGANNKADFYSVTSGGTMTLLKSLTSSDSIDFDGSATFTATSHDTGATTITGYFEEGEWYGTAPSVGNTTATALNTSNLDAPAVTPEENFNSLVYQGASPSDKAVTGVGFQPDLVWIKARTQAYSHAVYDSVRGATKELHTDTNYSEDTDSNGLKTFDSDGFTVGSDGEVGDPTGKRISWNWKAHQGGSTSYSNTLTLDVRDNYGSGSGWGTTKLEVWEGSTKLTDITNPPSSSSKIYNIKTNDLDKIKIVWYVDGSAGDWYNMYAVLKNSSNTTLASWDGNSWSGNSSDAPSDDDNFYLPSSFDSTNAATTGVVEAADADTERYNSSAGFTIIKYAGAGSSDGDTKTLNHSLGVPLEFVIAKARTSNGYDNGDWIVWHKDLSSSKYLYLNSNSAQRTESSGYDLISTTNSGSQHQVVVNNGTDGSSFNYHYLNSGEDYILYGWAGVEGYSKFGSFTGTGSATLLPFIYTGFEVGWLLTKNIDNGSVHWNLHDSARNPHNVVDERVWANLPNASDSNYDKFDFYSNGFRPVTGDAGHNGNGNTIIYAAFSSSSPFKHANAR